MYDKIVLNGIIDIQVYKYRCKDKWFIEYLIIYKINKYHILFIFVISWIKISAFMKYFLSGDVKNIVIKIQVYIL